MARKRAELSAWQRRNRLAVERGYTSYYDYRVHDYGRRPPGEARATGAELRRLRGHASRADLVRAAKPGSFVSMGEFQRDDEGRFRRIEVSLIDDDGTETGFWLQGDLSDEALSALADQLEDEGAAIVIWYPQE